MREYKNHLNNHGAALLTVIVCIAFLSIIGSLMLSVTMTNLQMKMVESKSKENFYSCEAAMEEIRVGIQELTADTIKRVYQEMVLTDYTGTMNYGDVNKEIRKQVITYLISGLSEKDPAEFIFTDTLGAVKNMDNTSVVTKESKLTVFLSSSVGIRITAGELYAGMEAVIIKDININYLNPSTGYQSSITSDIRINLPVFTAASTPPGSDTEYTTRQPYEGYCLIADGEIIMNNAGDNAVDGNVFSGEGITVERLPDRMSHIVTMTGPVIVTRGDITVRDTANLTIRPGTGGSKPVVWANNLITETTNQYPDNSDIRTNLSINGISLIRDDLALNGKNSEVVLNGAYVGYSANESAMMLNGTGSMLDLQQLKDLILAGRANIAVGDEAEKTNILTGESVGLKRIQTAYLIPGSFMPEVLHNPVTRAEITSLGRWPDLVIPASYHDINYNDYLRSSAKYQLAATNSTSLYYFYLNFASYRLADQFIKLYLSKGLLDPQTVVTETVKLPQLADARTMTVGNITYYDAGSGEVRVKDGLSAQAEFNDAADTEEQRQRKLENHIGGLTFASLNCYSGTLLHNATYSVDKLASLYNKISHHLNTEPISAREPDQFIPYTTYIPGDGSGKGVSYVIHHTTPEEVVSGGSFDQAVMEENSNYIWNSTDTTKKSFVLIDGNITVTSEAVFDGIMIATGQITVEAGTSANKTRLSGLVLSQGVGGANVILNNYVQVRGRVVSANHIIIGNNCDIATDSTMEAGLANLFHQKLSVLKDLFRNIKASETVMPSTDLDSFVKLSDIIVYENWRKNQ